MMLAILLSIIFACVSSADSIQLTTRTGQVVHGHQIHSQDPRFNTSITYASFQTIPFAKPPVGELRFAAPQPLDPGEVIDTTNITFQRMCYQLGDAFGLLPNIVDADEDCLYLHVYVPGVWPPPAPLPVMIWFTGGAFVMGAGNMYGPEYWMSHDIIIVAVNYRLGPFGFLTLGLEEAAGNQGLLDQRMSMIWVRDNIAQFGGDPDTVTIAGESAGSFSVFYHLISPGSQGLFNRVIGQSGMGALAPSYHHWQAEQGIRLGNELALMLGCLSFNIREELQCLKNQTAFSLQAAELDNGIISQPVIDWEFAADPFLPRDPLQALEEGEFATDVEILLGTNSHEGLLLTEVILNFNNIFFDIFMGNNWNIWGPILLLHKHALEITEEDSELSYKILEHYCGTRDVTVDHIVNMTDMFTDSYFLYGVTKYIDDYHLKFSSKPVYQYMNTYHNEKYQANIFHIPPLTPTLPGVSHADELFLQWSPFVFIPFGLSENDTVTSHQITSLWSNFIKTGHPGDVWSPVEAETKMYLNLNMQPRMEARDEYYKQRMQFWRSIY